MRRASAAALAAAVIFLNLAAAQQPPQAVPAFPAAAIGELDKIIESTRVTARMPGLSVAIAFRGEVVYSKGFGVADLEHQAAVTPRTAFRTASTAKPMTATAVMQLVERGALGLDAPIQTYCPAFPVKPWPVTARLLLGHQAGLRHYQQPGESVGKTHFFTIESALGLFKDDPLLHEPATKYLYSTYGYSVLGCAIEGAAKTSYERYMHEHVFTPARMTRTRLDRVYEIVPERARGYQVLSAAAMQALPAVMQSLAKVGEVYNADLHDTSMKIPGGGLLSTAEDLVRFMVAAANATLVSGETLEQMWTEGRTRDGTPTGYGLGWGVTPKQEGIRRLTHSGNQAGAASVMHILPEVHLAYAIMTNLEDAELGPISRGIAQTLRPHLLK